jgi:hypothetical protein
MVGTAVALAWMFACSAPNSLFALSIASSSILFIISDPPMSWRGG